MTTTRWMTVVRSLTVAVLFGAAALGQTLPDEDFLGTSEGAALDATVDGASGHATNVQYLSRTIGASEFYKYWHGNTERMLRILGPANQLRVAQENTALNVGVYPGVYSFQGTQYSFGGETGVAITDDATRYVYLASGGASNVTVGSAWPSPPYVPLAKVITASGVISSITDHRPFMVGHDNALTGATGTTSAAYQLSSSVSGPKIKATTTTKVDLRNSADSAYIDFQCDDATAATVTAADLTTTDTLAVASTATLSGAVSVATTNGVNCTPGSDTDADLLTVDVTGAPTVSWDESEDSIDVTHDVVLATGKRIEIADDAYVIPQIVHHFEDGAMSVSVWDAIIEMKTPYVIIDATGNADTAPSGGACIVDVRVNGLSIYSSQAEMVNIADGTTRDVSAKKDYSGSRGDLITFECEAANSASDVTVSLDVRLRMVSGQES